MGIRLKQPCEGGGTGNKAGEGGAREEHLDVRMENAKNEEKDERDLRTSVVSLEHHNG